jgi:hypothetical protein
MTPKEKSEKLILKYYFMLPNNGSQTGIVSIPVRWKEGIECAIATTDFILEEYNRITDISDASKSYIIEKEYWKEVKKELQIQLDRTNNENTTTSTTKR